MSSSNSGSPLYQNPVPFPDDTRQRDLFDQMLRAEEENQVPIHAILDVCHLPSGEPQFYVKYLPTDDFGNGFWISKSTLNTMCVRSPEVLSMVYRFEITFRSEKPARGVSLSDIRDTRDFIYYNDSCLDLIPLKYMQIEENPEPWIRPVGETRRTLRREKLFYFNTGFARPINGDVRHAYLYAYHLFRDLIRSRVGYADNCYRLADHMAGKLFHREDDNSWLNEYIWNGYPLKCITPRGLAVQQFSPIGNKATVLVFTAPSREYLLSPVVIVLLPVGDDSERKAFVYHLTERIDSQGPNLPLINNFLELLGVGRVIHRFLRYNPTTEHLFFCFTHIADLFFRNSFDDLGYFGEYGSVARLP